MDHFARHAPHARTVPPLAGLLLALSALVAAPSAAAQFTVEVLPNNTFSPQNLTIQVGDSVTWINQGGLHNVRATSGDDFRCANGCDGQGGNGDLSTAAWSFTLTFDDPATIDYQCDAHAAFGMVGRLIVQAGADPEPGTIRFAQASQQVAEGAGTASIEVERVGGTDGVVGVQYATANGSASAGSDYTAVSGALDWGDGDGSPKSFTVPILDDDNDESNETVNLTLSSPSGGAALGTSGSTLTITDDDDSSNSPGTLALSETALQVGEAAGVATVTVRRLGGSDGAVSVDYATTDGSASAGSDYTAVSGTLDWPDGDGAARTFDIPIDDDGETEADETINVMLSGVAGGADLGTSSATVTITDDDQPPPPPCVANETTLCLNEGGRFQVEVSWRDFQDNEGTALVEELPLRDSGLFYFFGRDNIEMLIKVLDACNLAGFETYWVAYAATTNVEFTVTVTDTVSGQVRQYSNELGELAAPVFDTAAFDTCP